MTSINDVARIGANYGRAMGSITAQLADPQTVADPAKLMVFQQQLSVAQSGYQFAARAIQDLQREDQLLGELLRDA